MRYTLSAPTFDRITRRSNVPEIASAAASAAYVTMATCGVWNDA